MPTQYEPLQCLHITPNENALFSAITLSMLLPVLTDTDAFEEAFERLFGDIKASELRTLRRELNKLTPNTLPASLPNLIKEYLRPKLAGYCLEHELATPTHDVDFERHAISAMLEVSIEYHHDTDNPTSTQPLSVYPEPGQSIHLLRRDGYLQPLINLKTLDFPLRTQLFPVQNTLLLAIIFKIGLVPLRSEDLKREINLAMLNLNHVNLEGAKRSNFPETWENAALVVARTIALIGLIMASILEIFAVFVYGFTIETSILLAPWSLLVLEILFLAVLVGAVIGMVSGWYAAEFGQALVIAKEHLDTGDCVRAAEVLDEQFSYAEIVKWARSWFLSSEHHAVAHFFRAVSAGDAGDTEIAYREYDLAQKEIENEPLRMFSRC